MESSGLPPTEQRAARWLNRLAPGAGLVLIGDGWLGVGIAAAFGLISNYLIGAALLFPRELTWTSIAALLAALAGLYLAAQWRLAAVERRHVARMDEAQRRNALLHAERLSADGQATDAARLLEQLLAERPDDLMVAHRLARLLTTCDPPAALAAWERVERLDRRRIYRAERLAAVEALQTAVR